MRLESRMEVGAWNGKLCQFEFGFFRLNLHFMKHISDVMTFDSTVLLFKL